MPLRKAVVAARESLLVNQFVASGLCGNNFGSFSKNFGSYATIAVTGASMVLAMFPDDSAGARRSLPSLVRTNTNRAGEELAEVGPNFRMS